RCLRCPRPLRRPGRRRPRPALALAGGAGAGGHRARLRRPGAAIAASAPEHRAGPVSAPRRRWWRRLGLAAAAVLLAALLLATWLLQTGSGRDAVLARLQAALPADALSWQRAEGTLAGPLQLHGLRYRQQDGLVLEIDRLALYPAPWPSLGGRLQLAVLKVVVLRLPLEPPQHVAVDPPHCLQSLIL